MAYGVRDCGVGRTRVVSPAAMKRGRASGNVWSLFALKSSSGVTESIHGPIEFSEQFP